MGKDIVWFLRRWAKTYLLVDEKLYGQVSDQDEEDQCDLQGPKISGKIPPPPILSFISFVTTTVLNIKTKPYK